MYREQQLDFFDLLDLEEQSQENESPSPTKSRGRPPTTLKNPLDGIPSDVYMNRDGRPQVWLDDCLTGAIRIVGQRDQRSNGSKDYVSLSKVFAVLSRMQGELTSTRIAKALGVHREHAWRIIKVIEFASFSIDRALASPTRIAEYRVPRWLKPTPELTKE